VAGTTLIAVLSGPPLGLIAPALLTVLVIRAILVHRPVAWPRSSSVVALTGTYLAVSIAWLLLGGAVPVAELLPEPAVARADSASHSAPANVYVLLLDGYPGDADTFGIDNEPFLTDLESRGFVVSRDSRSLHYKTELSLLDMLGGVTGISEPQLIPPPNVSERRAVRRLLAAAPATEELRALGYELVNITPPSYRVALVNWDRVITAGHLSELEIAMLGRSSLHPFVAEWVMDDQRQRILDGLDELVAQAGAQGRFVLAHLNVPHTPFLWDATGQEVPAPRCWPACSMFAGPFNAQGLTFDGYAMSLTAQVLHANGLVRDALDRLIAADPEAKIVVLSDHGARYDVSDMPEHFRNLFAVRGANIGPTLDNLFMRLAQAEPTSGSRDSGGTN
jgi:hypothetical protein